MCLTFAYYHGKTGCKRYRSCNAGNMQPRSGLKIPKAAFLRLEETQEAEDMLKITYVSFPLEIQSLRQQAQNF